MPRKSQLKADKRVEVVLALLRREEPAAALARPYQGPNELWQALTYLHIPGYGWWYTVKVIAYYSRYLLALRWPHKNFTWPRRSGGVHDFDLLLAGRRVRRESARRPRPGLYARRAVKLREKYCSPDW